MTILLVCPYPVHELGGVTVMVSRLQEGLRARGHRALLLEAGRSAAIVRSPDSGRLDTYRVYLRRAWYDGATGRSFAGFLVYLPLALWSLWRFCQRERVDVVHVHFPTPRLLYFSVLRMTARWRLVATFHGTDGYSLRRRSRTYRRALRMALSAADVITAVSADLLGVVRGVYPRLRSKSKALPNGNPMVLDRRAADSRQAAMLPEGYVLAVGSLIPRKAYDVLLTAVRAVRETGCDMRLVVVGDGPEAPSLRALASKLGIAAAVTFVGEVPHDELGPLYHGAKFFVHAAREEGFGMVIVEAMSCRKAVVATRVGGIPEFVRDGETGILVSPDDPESLADAIMRLEKDAELRSAMGERGYELATRQFGWERMVDEYLGAYDRSAEGHRAA